MLTSQPPFVRPTALQLLFAHAHDPVVPLSERRPDLPADLQAIVLRCLEKEPAKRFADVTEVARALAHCPVEEVWTEERATRWWQEYPRGDARRGSPSPEPVATTVWEGPT